MDNLDFLDEPSLAETPAATPEPAPEAPRTEQTAEPAPEAPSDGQPRGPDGKFAPKAPEATPEPQPAPAAVSEPAKPEPGFVPLAALLDTRDENKALKEQLRQYQQRQASAPPPAPDPYEDPEGFQRHQQALVADTRWQTVTEFSQVLANKEHGAETVQKAAEAFLAEVAQKPWLEAELRQQPHPYEYVVQRYQREQMLSQIRPDELAQFQAWKAAQAQAQTLAPGMAPAPPATPQPPARPSPSLASAPSAGGVQTQVVEDPFEAEFPKR